MSKPVPGADTKGVLQVSDQYRDAINRGDVAGFLATLTDDAVMLPPHEPSVSGKNAIRPWIAKAFFDPFKLQLDFHFEEVEVLGEVAVARGPFKLSLTPKTGGSVIEDKGKFIDILRRQPDGSWKFARVIWNSDGPLPATA